MRRSTTKSALLMSVISLFLCFAMLMGSTFAWFTDVAESAKNLISAGNLDIELYHSDSAVTGEKVTGTTYLFDDVTSDKWEPGAMAYEKFTVKNEGNLALKYQFTLNALNATVVSGTSFASILKVAVVGADFVYNRENIMALTNWESLATFTLDGELTAGGSEDFGIIIWWQPSEIDNLFNMNNDKTGKVSVEVGVVLTATQLNSESDSIDKDYDKPAPIPSVSITQKLPESSADAEDIKMATSTTTVALNAAAVSNIIDNTNVESVALKHAEPVIDKANNKVTFEYFDIVDENGTPIDLEALNNSEPITVTIPVGDAFAEGDVVLVYHDGEHIADATVTAGAITYTATHFCEITVGYNDGKIDTVLELNTTVNAAKDGDTIVFGGDITSVDGILVNGKDLTIDLNGYTFTVSEGTTTSSRAIKIVGDSVATVKNGTIVADGDITSGAYGSIRTEDSANVTLENLKLYSYRGYGLNIKANTGTTVVINNCEIYAQYGGGVEAAGGTAVLNNTKIEQSGVYSDAAWCSVAIGVNGNGKVVINSGEYSAATIATDANAAQGNWVAYVMSSGGTLDINGGTFNGAVAETAAAANACGVICADRAAVVNIYGGTFNSNGAILDMRNNVGTLPNPVATIYGGTFSADPTISGLYSSNLISLADGCEVVKIGDAYAVGKPVTTADELKAAITGAKDGDVILIANDITVSDKWDNRYGGRTDKAVTIDGLGNTLKFTGTVADGGNYHSVFRFEGVATVKNLTFDLSEAEGSNNRVRSISAKSDLTVENCTFIGNTAITNTRAISFGEGAGSAIGELDVVITGCSFTGWRKAISDNENAQDAKTVTVKNNVCTNSGIAVSAAESIEVVGNTMNGCDINITSYYHADNVKVVATGNTLDADQYNVIGSASKLFTAANVTAQEGFVVNVAE